MKIIILLINIYINSHILNTIMKIIIFQLVLSKFIKLTLILYNIEWIGD